MKDKIKDKIIQLLTNHPISDFSDFIFQEDLPEMRLQTKIHKFSK